nr:hypothetical protein [Tolivirales sp.]
MNNPDARVASHVRMLLDPCEAPLGLTAYRGADGIVTRFRNQISVNVPGSSAHVYVYYPAYNGIWSQSIADYNAALVPSYTTAGPGQAFMLATAESQRVVSACSRISYTGSELDRQGMVYRGLLPEAALSGCSVNTLIPLLQCADRVPDHVLETKFVPNASEEEYWKTGSVAPEANGDRNAIVMVVIGNPAALTPFAITTVLVAEWRPKFGVGMQVPSPNTADSPAGLERVRTALSRAGQWWLEGSRTLSAGLQFGSQVVRGARLIGGAARLAIMA